MIKINMQRGSYLELEKSEDYPGEYFFTSYTDAGGLMYFSRNQLAELRNAITNILDDRPTVSSEYLASLARPFTPYERAKLILALKYQQNDPSFDPT